MGWAAPTGSALASRDSASWSLSPSFTSFPPTLCCSLGGPAFLAVTETLLHLHAGSDRGPCVGQATFPSVAVIQVCNLVPMKASPAPLLASSRSFLLLSTPVAQSACKVSTRMWLICPRPGRSEVPLEANHFQLCLPGSRPSAPSRCSTCSAP